MKFTEKSATTPKEKPNYDKKNYLINKLTALVGIIALIIALTPKVKDLVNYYKRSGQIAISRCNKIFLSRKRDTFIIRNYLSLRADYGQQKSFLGLQLVVWSLTRQDFHKVLRADSIQTSQITSPLMDIQLDCQGLKGNVEFSAALDSAELSNLPTGFYECEIQGLIDTIGKTVTLKRFSFNFETNMMYGLRGHFQYLKRHSRRKRAWVYPRLGIDTY